MSAYSETVNVIMKSRVRESRTHGSVRGWHREVPVYSTWRGESMKADVIKKYFQSWIDKDIEIVKQTFSENALYSECYGPEYHGLSQIVTWFEDWNNKGQVLEWTIKRILEQNQTLIVEWYFKCNYDGRVDGFDGVTIADFDNDMKISKLCEFQSKAEHYYPYES